MEDKGGQEAFDLARSETGWQDLDSIAYDSNAIFSRSFFDDSPTPYPTIHCRGKKITGERETTNPKFTANLQ